MAYMDEGRKRVLLIAAAILVAGHLKDLDLRRSPGMEGLIHDAVRLATKIMEKIDRLYPLSEAPRR